MVAGTLDKVRTFPPGQMAERVAGVPGVSWSFERYYQEVLDHVEDPLLRSAIQALIERSPAWRKKQAWRKRFVGAARYLRWRFR